jgi:hypothetical protein
LISILASCLAVMGGDRSYVAVSFVTWSVLILCMRFDSPAPTTKRPIGKSQDLAPISFIDVKAVLSLLVPGIESFLGMIIDSSTRMLVCFSSWILFLIFYGLVVFSCG